MRSYDFSPLYRSTIGFDSVSRLLDAVAGGGLEGPSYPPYNIEKLRDNQYRIVMALAGIGEDDLEVTQQTNTLVVRGKSREAEEGTRFLHRGIAQRGFERRFQLADYVNVTGAKLENGLLTIDLEREVPEAMRPRTIAIQSVPRAIEAKAA